MGIPEDLNLLEKNIDRLRFEYDQYFMAVTKVPPHTIQTAVERLIRKYVMVNVHNSAQRFRYQNLVARYNSMKELWKRRLRMKEEGIVIGGRALQPSFSPPPEMFSGQVTASTPEKDTKTTSKKEKFKPFAATTSDPNKEKQVVSSLYKEYMRAHHDAGQGDKKVSMEAFQKLIEKQVSTLKKSHKCSKVNFRVDIKDGEVKLKAKPIK